MDGTENRLYRLTDDQQEEFRKLVSKLFIRNSILRSKTNPKTHRVEDNKDYDKCRAYEYELVDFFRFCGISLKHDIDREIFYIESMNDSSLQRRSVGKDGTYLLIAFKHFFDEQCKQTSSIFDDVHVKLIDIKTWANDAGLITYSIPATTQGQILDQFKKKNIINFNGYGKDLEDNADIYITPIITTIVKSTINEKLNEKLDQKLKEYNIPETDDEAPITEQNISLNFESEIESSYLYKGEIDE